MRARELFEKTLKGAELPDSTREALPNGTLTPDLAGDYEYYRLLTALAGVPENPDIPLNSVLKDKPIVVPYTQMEHDQVVKMLKKMKKDHEHLTIAPSGEMDSVHKISPVRTFKDYGA
jgi:hypothetical protein